MINTLIKEVENRIINGGRISRQEAARICAEADLDTLCDAADRICRHFMPGLVDSCSIVNARSGLCSEDCKWCAQASRHHTGCQTYDFAPEQEVMQAARINEKEGIRRFSLVTSGRAVPKRDIPRFCEIIRRLKKETSLYVCVSMGLLDKESLQQLHEAGAERYHCNMETSAEHFKTLCTTHTPEDKRATIRAAREVGMQVCSGGIIGMGETMEQRLDLAFELAEMDVDSVPINILTPIPGTPLQDTPAITEEEIARTVAMFRLILPQKALRFAGGRLRLSPEMSRRIMNGGMNGVLMGDMLTTVSKGIASDRELFAATNWQF